MAEFTLPGTLSRMRHRQTSPLVLELDLTEGLSETPPTDLVSAFLTMRRPRLADVLDALRRARTDDRVKALIVKVGGHPIGLARVQELRAAVADFARAGKITVAWAETFGDFGPGNVHYYLATAFSRICLQPSGAVGLTGLHFQLWFFRDALDRIGVEFQYGRRKEFKSATERFTERRLTAPSRQALEQVASSLASQLTDAIADRLHVPAAEARAVIDRGPHLAEEALEAGLVDTLAYRDEVYEDVRGQVGPEAHLLYLSRYHRSRIVAERARALPLPSEGAVALIYAAGPIRRGRSGHSPLGGATGSDTVGAAIRAATADRHVHAIVLRINSPGGSYVASDSIWREVVRAQARGTPVIVSMGDVAASGGYFIAMAAHQIVAQPGTLTGSIGVLSGKPVIAGLLRQAGVTTDRVTEGRHADMFSTAEPFGEEAWSRINTWLDRIYQDFTAKVAAGRGLSTEQVDQVARGRVWTGADAHERGLVDRLGGLDASLDLARRAAHLPDTAPVRVFPRMRPLDRLRPPESSEDRAAARASLLAESWGPAWRLAAEAGLPPFGPLLLPGNWTIQ